ncbi:hypothetical protein D3C72_223580 [compost metagenome]
MCRVFGCDLRVELRCGWRSSGRSCSLSVDRIARCRWSCQSRLPAGIRGRAKGDGIVQNTAQGAVARRRADQPGLRSKRLVSDLSSRFNRPSAPAKRVLPVEPVPDQGGPAAHHGAVDLFAVRRLADGCDALVASAGRFARQPLAGGEPIQERSRRGAAGGGAGMTRRTGFVRLPGGHGVKSDFCTVLAAQGVAVVHIGHVALEAGAARRRRRRPRRYGAGGFGPDIRSRPAQRSEEGDDDDKRRRDLEAPVPAGAPLRAAG